MLRRLGICFLFCGAMACGGNDFKPTVPQSSIDGTQSSGGSATGDQPDVPDPPVTPSTPAAPTDNPTPPDSGTSTNPATTDNNPPPRQSTAPFRVLFDAAHHQVDGGADWIVDTHAPNPQPAHPTSEQEWNGALSSWGFALVTSGRYTVAQLPVGHALTYGQDNIMDLQHFDVFVSSEPEAMFQAAEKQALFAFARAGKGLVLACNHRGAKRCNGCVEAIDVINNFLDHEGAAFGLHCDGAKVADPGTTGTLNNAPLAAALHQGPFGTGQHMAFHLSTTVSVTQPEHAAAVVLNTPAGGTVGAAELLEGGRLVLIGDSSPSDDGTCRCATQSRLHDGWNEMDDGKIILNATAFVAHDAVH